MATSSISEVLEKIIDDSPAPPRRERTHKAPPSDGMTRAQFAATIRSIDEKARTIEFAASTEAVDRYGDIIRVSGWKLDNYRKNPVFMWAHRSTDPPIGKTVSIATEANPPALVHRVQFADAATYPFADTIFRLYKGGFLRGVSVGFLPLESKPILNGEGQYTGREFTSQELLELSGAPIPANAETLARAIDAGEFDREDVELAFAEEKTVCPYKADPIAPKGTKWDAAAEMATAHDPVGWRRMCTVIVGDPKNKTSYKLPHHQGPNNKWRVVPDGVRAALGRFEKTQMAASDRPGARAHLVKHQKAIAAQAGVDFDDAAFEARLASLGEAFRSAEAADLEDAAALIEKELDAHVATLDRIFTPAIAALDDLFASLVGAERGKYRFVRLPAASEE